MNQSRDVLSDKLITSYWCDFKSGSTWNYYNWSPRYLRDDTWATKDVWVSAAKDCLENKTNVLQALEILLDVDYEKYISMTEEILSAWFEKGAYDEYYYYDLISFLPKQHKIRKSIFTVESNREVFADDRVVSLLRKALARASDETFFEMTSNYFTDIFKRGNLEIDLLERSIMPVLMDLGDNAKSCISVDNLERLKQVCMDYFRKDRILIEGSFLGDGCNPDERQVWVGDDLAYWSWVLGWTDLLSELEQDDLYWIALFSEFWIDQENNNLLIWSLLKDSKILRNRAEIVMKTDDTYKLDGAIALSRLERH